MADGMALHGNDFSMTRCTFLDMDDASTFAYALSSIWGVFLHYQSLEPHAGFFCRLFGLIRAESFKFACEEIDDE